MKLKIALAAAAALAVSAAGAHATQTNYVKNGAFENDPVTSGYYNIASSGADNVTPADFDWTVTNGNVDIIAHNSFGGSFSNAGLDGIDLVGYGSTGGITQTFNLPSAGTYYLAFQYQTPYTTGAGADVTFNGVTVNVVGTTTDKFYYAAVTGLSGANTLSFVSTGGGANSGLYIDNVQVTAAPEPGVWALMIAGLAMMGGALRLRRRQTGAVAAA